MLVIMNPEKKIVKAFKILGDTKKNKKRKKKMHWYPKYAQENQEELVEGWEINNEPSFSLILKGLKQETRLRGCFMIFGLDSKKANFLCIVTNN